jgi:hypothetical protein
MLKAVKAYVWQHHLALVALFVALGGASYAAVNLPRNSVGAGEIKRNAVRSSEVKKNAVRSSEVKDNALSGRDVRESTLGKVPRATAADSATSAKTATTANTAGSAATATSANPEAFARIRDEGTAEATAAGIVDVANSKGVTGANVTSIESGDTYCFHGLAFQPRGGQVTTDYNNTQIPVVPQFAIGTVVGCPTGTQAFVYTPSSGQFQSFFVVFYR